LYIPNARVRGCFGSLWNINPSGELPGRPRASRIVAGRSTCDVGAVEIVMGPVRSGGLISITAFAVEAIAGSRTVDGPGTNARLSLFPPNPSGSRSVP
jgi:hypothetical protein